MGHARGEHISEISDKFEQTKSEQSKCFLDALHSDKFKWKILYKSSLCVVLTKIGGLY